MVEFAVYDLYPLLGAGSFSISSAIMRKMEYFGTPTQLNLIRTSIGAILFLLHLVLLGDFTEISSLSMLIIFYLVLSVFFNVATGDTLYFSSQNKIGIKIANPITNTFPLFTIIIAVLFLDELVSTELILGGIVIIIGITFLSFDKEKEDTSQKNKEWGLGLTFAFIATILYALGIIFTTVATEGLDPVVANSIRLPSGTVMLLILLLSQFLFQPNSKDDRKITGQLKNASSKDLILLLTAGVLGTYGSSLFLVLSVQAIGASRSAVLFATGPFFSLPIAVLWLKEKVGFLTLIGTVLTVAGLWIILG